MRDFTHGELAFMTFFVFGFVTCILRYSVKNTAETYIGKAERKRRRESKKFIDKIFLCNYRDTLPVLLLIFHGFITCISPVLMIFVLMSFFIESIFFVAQKLFLVMLLIDMIGFGVICLLTWRWNSPFLDWTKLAKKPKKKK